MSRHDVAALLAAHDAQLRAHVHEPLPESIGISRDGPLVRTVGFGDRGWVEYHDLGGLEGAELDELIARQVQFFTERGEPFEWKYYGHDRPADLPQRLVTAGFEPEETETVVIGLVADLAFEPSLPENVSIREVTERADLRRIGTMEEAVWDEDHSWLDDLATEREADPEGLRIFVAEAGDIVVSAGWVRFPVRHGVRDALGRRDPRGVAQPRHLPRTGRRAGTHRSRARAPRTSRPTRPTTAARSSSGSVSSP